MSQGFATTVQAIGGVLSALAALSAVLVALHVERRARQRFQQQLDRETRIAHANLKPLLAVYPSKFINHKAVRLENYGLGTAVITSISFSENGRVVQHRNLAKLFSLPHSPVWDYFWTFREKVYYVRSGEKIIMVELTMKNLLGQGFDESTALSILKNWQEQLNKITIDISYEDILGNPQEPYKVTLTG